MQASSHLLNHLQHACAILDRIDVLSTNDTHYTSVLLQNLISIFAWKVQNAKITLPIYPLSLHCSVEPVFSKLNRTLQFLSTNQVSLSGILNFGDSFMCYNGPLMHGHFIVNHDTNMLQMEMPLSKPVMTSYSHALTLTSKTSSVAIHSDMESDCAHDQNISNPPNSMPDVNESLCWEEAIGDKESNFLKDTFGSDAFEPLSPSLGERCLFEGSPDPCITSPQLNNEQFTVQTVVSQTVTCVTQARVMTPHSSPIIAQRVMKPISPPKLNPVLSPPKVVSVLLAEGKKTEESDAKTCKKRCVSDDGKFSCI